MGNIFTVTLPDIGEGVVEGEVIEWLKKVGDPVKQDEPVVVVMTDKATVELPAPHPGKISKHYFQPGQIAIKDKPLYDIELSGESAKPTAEVQEKVAKPESKPQQQPITKSNKPKPEKVVQTQEARTSVSVALATPPVRHLAKQLGIDLQEVQGTGKDGRVTFEDLRGKQGPGPAPAKVTNLLRLPDDEEEAVIGVRNLMARKMAESKANIPHFSYFEQADATRLIQLRSNIKKEADKEGVKVTYMPFIIKALSVCINKFPSLNSTYDMANGKLYLHKRHNIGIAVSSQWGLIVPVLKDVQDMSIEQLIRAYDDLVHRAQSGKIPPNEMKESTITISNFGGLGGTGQWATPIINYPESAILAVGRIQKQPVVKDDAVVVRDVMNLSWSFDHRIIDGDMAVHISHAYCGLIQNPGTLL